jgi:hypothetical protein
MQNASLLPKTDHRHREPLKMKLFRRMEIKIEAKRGSIANPCNPTDRSPLLAVQSYATRIFDKGLGKIANQDPKSSYSETNR